MLRQDGEFLLLRLSPPRARFHRVSYIYFIRFVIIFPQREDLGLVFPSTVFFFHAEGVPGKGPPRLRASPPVPARSSAAPAPLRSGQTKGSAGAAEPFNPSLPPHRHPIAFLTAFNLLFLFLLLLDLHLFFFSSPLFKEINNTAQLLGGSEIQINLGKRRRF